MNNRSEAVIKGETLNYLSQNTPFVSLSPDHFTLYLVMTMTTKMWCWEPGKMSGLQYYVGIPLPVSDMEGLADTGSLHVVLQWPVRLLRWVFCLQLVFALLLVFFIVRDWESGIYCFINHTSADINIQEVLKKWKRSSLVLFKRLPYIS